MKTTQGNLKNSLFSEKRLIARQLRAIRINSDGADFLAERVAEDFCHRISATNRNFTKAADLFSLSDKISSALKKLRNVSGITRYELPEVSEILAKKSDFAICPLSNAPTQANVQRQTWPRNLDLVVSAFGLHSSNDLPRFMSTILQSMKEDGLLLIALPVGGTLNELRDCLTRAELELTGGAALRIDPFIDLQQAGKLLQTAGFKLPVVDREDVTVRYDNAFVLIDDLRSMGMTSALAPDNDCRPHRNLFKRADELYRENYCDADGRIRASFCIAYLTAWSPHENQQKPLKPGSAEFSLAGHLKSK